MIRSPKALPALFALIFLIHFPSIGHAWQAKVVSVVDGDSITVLRDGNQQVEVRLYGIDCPEIKQDYGQKAREMTSALVAGRNVDIEQKDTDRYGRVVGLVKVDGSNLNEAIIQNGFGWVYREYCKDSFCSAWLKFETAARQQKKGMWADPQIIPPWEWRHGQKEVKVKEESAPVILLGGNPSTTNRGSGGHFKCDGRTYCSQMTSCEEATFFIKNCPGTKMDGDKDGVPCESQWCR